MTDRSHDILRELYAAPPDGVAKQRVEAGDNGRGDRGNAGPATASRVV